MIFSSTALASGVDTAAALVGTASGVVAAILTFLLLRHHRDAQAWLRRFRHVDEDAKDFENASKHLGTLLELLCGWAHKPCRTANFEPLHALRHLLDDAAENTEPIRSELQAVVERLDRYLATALPPLPADARVTGDELTAQLALAMKQEHARAELKNAVSATQKRIRSLSRAT
ncbi:hypothetical protein [Streptomyces sp. NPDC001833]|uniref:hypothetical protein n=1 Tax=Streptomyces sp. NPDC001833 TaxID=3154658 RepID=UPI00332896A4